MGTKYTSESISGYNSSPPSDDGSATEANKVKWSTIKSKLPDPLKTAIENINTKLVNAADVGVDSYATASPSIGAADNGRLIALDSSSTAQTPTLAAASTLGDGWECSFILTDATNGATITTNSTETINGVDDGVTLTNLYSYATIKCDGSGFYVTAISPQMRTAVSASSSTTHDFTIPSWATQIDIVINRVSLSTGTSPLVITIGDSGGLETTGYQVTGMRHRDSTATASWTHTTSFKLMGSFASAADEVSGVVTLRALGSSNGWLCTSLLSGTDGPDVWHMTGSKALSAAITQLRLTTSAGTSFDNGTINVHYA